MKKKVMVVLMAIVLLLSYNTVVWAEDSAEDDKVIIEDMPDTVTVEGTEKESEDGIDKVSADANLTSGNDIADGVPIGTVQNKTESQVNTNVEKESEIAINESNFPDENFREFVRAQFDSDSNGGFSRSEIEAAKTIIIPVDSPRVQSLKGIEYFTELSFLSCNENPSLSSVDLSYNNKLREASVRNCQLTSLKLPPNITGIDCSGNQLTSLDISNTSVQILWCNNNPLTSLITNSMLMFLECDNNQLATLELSNELGMGLRKNGNAGSPGHHGEMHGAFIGSQSISANAFFNSGVWTVDMVSLVGNDYLDRVTIVTEGAVLSLDGIVTFSGSDRPKELVYEFDTKNPAEYTPMTVNVMLSGINAPATEGTSFNTSGLDMNNICGVNGLNPSTDNAEVTLSQKQAAKKDITKLQNMANEHGLSVVASYEIIMELFANGNKITEVTENFGTLELTLKVGSDYLGRKATVYQLHNKEEIIVHDGLIVDADGTVTITVDRLSTFTVAVDKATENQEQISPQKPTDNSVRPSPQKPTDTTPTSLTNVKSPKTGDSSQFILWGGLCVIAMMGFVGCMRKKHHNM